MLKLYAHPWSPFSIRVQLLLEEIQQPYQYEHINLEAGEQLRPPYQHLNPLGRVPAIDYEGFVLAESNAILRYLCCRFGHDDWYPANLEQRAVVDQWMDFAGIHAGTPITKLAWECFWVHRFHRRSDERAVTLAAKKARRELPIINRHLQSSRYLAGQNPTLADIAFLPLIYCASFANFSLAPYPSIENWFRLMSSRPAWVKLTQSLPKLPPLPPLA